MRRAPSLSLLTILPLLVLSSCGSGGSSSSWKDLKAVRVTLSRPGIPPPGGLAHTIAFTSGSELALVTAALNKHHIQKAATSSSSNGCAGGQNVMIAITRSDGSVTNLSAYRCAGQTTGGISGDLLGFLNAAGVPDAI